MRSNLCIVTFSTNVTLNTELSTLVQNKRIRKVRIDLLDKQL